MLTLINSIRVLGAIVLMLFALPNSVTTSSEAETEEEQHNCQEFGGASRSPHYTIEKKNHSAGGSHPLNLYMSLSEEAIGSRDLVNFACRINHDFPSEPRVDAYIFDDKKAAKNIALGFEDQQHYIAYLWHLKARYHLDRESNQEFIEFVFPELRDGLLNLKRVKMWLPGSPV